jgi:hypothetical protein
MKEGARRNAGRGELGSGTGSRISGCTCVLMDSLSANSCRRKESRTLFSSDER